MRFGVRKRVTASMRMVAAGLAVAASLISAEAQTLAAMPAPAQGASTTGAARPIAGWSEFCQGYPGECALDRAAPAFVTLTPAVWQTINAVNRRVNKALRAVTDLDHWGTADRWDLAEDGSGDCEDYQLLKRRLLAEAGLSRRAMRMTVVIDDKGEGHAVLTVLTNRGDLILDNKTGAVLPWTQTGYSFVKRESQDAPAWVGLGPAAAPATTANR